MVLSSHIPIFSKTHLLTATTGRGHLIPRTPAHETQITPPPCLPLHHRSRQAPSPYHRPPCLYLHLSGSGLSYLPSPLLFFQLRRPRDYFLDQYKHNLNLKIVQFSLHRHWRPHHLPPAHSRHCLRRPPPCPPHPLWDAQKIDPAPRPWRGDRRIRRRS